MKISKNNGSYFYAGWEAAKDYFCVGVPNQSYSDVKEANKWREYWNRYDSGDFDPEENLPSS